MTFSITSENSKCARLGKKFVQMIYTDRRKQRQTWSELYTDDAEIIIVEGDTTRRYTTAEQFQEANIYLSALNMYAVLHTSTQVKENFIVTVTGFFHKQGAKHREIFSQSFFIVPHNVKSYIIQKESVFISERQQMKEIRRNDHQKLFMNSQQTERYDQNQKNDDDKNNNDNNERQDSITDTNKEMNNEDESIKRQADDRSPSGEEEEDDDDNEEQEEQPHDKHDYANEGQKEYYDEDEEEQEEQDIEDEEVDQDEDIQNDNEIDQTPTQEQDNKTQTEENKPITSGQAESKGALLNGISINKIPLSETKVQNYQQQIQSKYYPNQNQYSTVRQLSNTTQMRHSPEQLQHVSSHTSEPAQKTNSKDQTQPILKITQNSQQQQTPQSSQYLNRLPSPSSADAQQQYIQQKIFNANDKYQQIQQIQQLPSIIPSPPNINDGLLPTPPKLNQQSPAKYSNPVMSISPSGYKREIDNKENERLLRNNKSKIINEEIRSSHSIDQEQKVSTPGIESGDDISFGTGQSESNVTINAQSSISQQASAIQQQNKQKIINAKYVPPIQKGQQNVFSSTQYKPSTTQQTSTSQSSQSSQSSQQQQIAQQSHSPAQTLPTHAQSQQFQYTSNTQVDQNQSFSQYKPNNKTATSNIGQRKKTLQNDQQIRDRGQQKVLLERNEGASHNINITRGGTRIQRGSGRGIQGNSRVIQNRPSRDYIFLQDEIYENGYDLVFVNDGRNINYE
ncbi:MAG: hypothetical protein EZS28_002381 [Streblomastix strix]|uniref:NTF2 domain-containing protein n=1 Tax=Streblomastix strix TaxID=222440 RepID=A0A5J4X643_9EUKA|nr:MAG: hypothetical protein EZS28_002381 [Streblomastix strix]